MQNSEQFHRQISTQRTAASAYGALVAAILMTGVAGCGSAEDPAVATGAESGSAVLARAEIRSCGDAEINGLAVLIERPSSEGIKLLDVKLEVNGLSDGQHAVHVHETAQCTPCGAAGGHHDPGPFGATAPDAPDFNHPFHGGDLINLKVNNGVGTLSTTTSRFTLSPGRLSVFDDDGSAVIIHSGTDTYCDQEDELAPGCAGGARDACGILRLVVD